MAIRKWKTLGDAGVIILSLLVATIVLVAFVGNWALLVGLVLSLYNLYFFRDPERTPDPSKESIVSAADGVVMEITEADEEYFCKARMKRVSIFLSIFDVHVQRSPIAGNIELVKRLKGKFLDARNPEASLHNVSRVIGIRDGGFSMVVRQISGLIARRIVGWRGAGDPVRKGERLGMIRYGSRVDMYLPVSVELAVKVGQRVVGGETVIGYRKEN